MRISSKNGRKFSWVTVVVSLIISIQDPCKVFSNNFKTTTSYTEDNINKAPLIIDLALLKFNFEKKR